MHSTRRTGSPFHTSHASCGSIRTKHRKAVVLLSRGASHMAAGASNERPARQHRHAEGRVMNAFIELERVEFRVLGALRCLDAVTGTPIERAMSVEAQGTRIVRNRSGLYVLIEAPGFDDYNASFPAPPATPAVGSVAFPVTVSDPLGAYLPRSASISLPRDPDPANAGSDASLFRPIELPMLPSPAGAVATNWAVLRLSVTANNGDCLGGALIRVLRNGSVLARGLSDWRGEALVPVAGVPVTT